MPIKKWWTSKTIWSDVATIGMAMLPAIDQSFGTHITTSPLYGTVLALLGSFGIAGRAAAKSTIG
jgi:hypothetical protein